MIQVTCSNCGIRILVPPTVQGRDGVCFGCGSKLQVPLTQNSSDLPSLQYSEGDTVSDRYEIRGFLGKGGMGVVYQAWDRLIDEAVALKFMKPKMLRTQRGQKLFIQEAQVARRLRHDNIAAVHDVSWTPEGVLYLSMELLQGHSLRAFLRTHRQQRKLVNVRLAVSIVEQMLDALSYAHKMVVHRDVKPENVMLLPGERVKVLDFGLAKAIDEEQQQAARSGKRIVGTLAYSAPEQRHHQPVDLRTDIYAVGLVLRELLTLRTPVDEDAPVDRVRNDVAPSIIRILDKAVETDRESRWQSAQAFRESLMQAYAESYRHRDLSDLTHADGRTVSTEGMVFLEGGSFLMGNNEIREEAPQFEAHVEPFFMDRYPVTVAQYETFVSATGHPEPKFWRSPELSGPDQPVVGITWNDAMAYAAWAGKQLPSEAQWEFAAAGRSARRYPWGALKPEPTRSNFGDNIGMPTMVTMHEDGQTPEGICDLAGNVYEWTLDSFVPYIPDRAGAVMNAKNEPRRVVRGGSWHSPPEELRSSFRKGFFPESQLTTLGFRCVVTRTD